MNTIYPIHLYYFPEDDISQDDDNLKYKFASPTNFQLLGAILWLRSGVAALYVKMSSLEPDPSPDGSLTGFSIFYIYFLLNCFSEVKLKIQRPGFWPKEYVKKIIYFQIKKNCFVPAFLKFPLFISHPLINFSKWKSKINVVFWKFTLQFTQPVSDHLIRHNHLVISA